jgi:hypothetical protein
MFNDEENYYTNTVYKHNGEFYQTYYGEKYPHIIDIVSKHSPFQIRYSDNAFFSTKTREREQASGVFKPVKSFYDHVIFYNSVQSSGKRPIEFITNPFAITNIPVVATKRTDDIYKLSNIRDAVINHSDTIWDKTIYPEFNSVNTTNIDFTKSLFSSQRLRDTYLGMRLYFQPEENYHIHTDLVTTMNRSNNR